MATLEKIRSKSVLLVVIIAVALLAFILGDAITNGRNLFGNNTTVAKVGNDKIEYPEYQRKQQELSQQLEDARRQNPQQYAGFDSQVLPQQTIEQLINEKLLANAINEVGIKTSPELLRFYMIENPIETPELVSIVNALRQSGIQVNSVEEAYNAIFNPASVGLNERQVEPIQKAWLAMESQYSMMISQMVYVNLLNQSFKANNLDKAAMQKDYAKYANVKVAKKPYGELDEKEYPVSDEEVQNAYNEHKEEYAIKETTKEISFIAVDILPSKQDEEEAKKLGETVISELRAGSLSKETRKGLNVQHHETTLNSVRNGSLKMFLQYAVADSVTLLPSTPTGFNIAKLNSREIKVDSLKVGFVEVVNVEPLVTEVSRYVNSGMPLDSIYSRFPMDSVYYQAPQWLELYSADGSVPRNLGLQQNVYDSLYNNAGRYLEINRQEGGSVRFASIVEKGRPVEIVDYETVEYTLHPSDATVLDARAKLDKFIADNNTAAKFAENAAAAGYNAVEMFITPSTPAIPRGFGGYYPDSRAVVRWVVMDGKDGQVSKIYQDRDIDAPTLYVAAVQETFNDYMPWNSKDVKEQLTAQVRRSKAGDNMVKKYAKSTVEESAAAMEVESVEVPTLQSNRYDRTVSDIKVKGRIMGSKPSNKVQVVKGDDGVYAYIITAVDMNPVEDGQIDFGEMFLQGHQIDPAAVLRGNKKIENNIYKFEQGE